MAKKTKFEKLNDALVDWAKEDEGNRKAFCIFGDEKGQYSSCGLIGDEEGIVSALCNEMMADEDICRIMKVAVAVYDEAVKELKEKEKPRTKLPKRILS